MTNQTRNKGTLKRNLDPEIQEKDKKVKKKNKVLSEKDELVSLTEKFKDLQKKYNLLLNENKSLQDKLNLVKKETPLKKDLKTKESQTMFTGKSEIQFPCKECIFVGNCEDEVRWHMTYSHEYPDPDHYGKDTCLDCGKLFDTKCQIMTHRKECHPNLIKPCSFFMEGKCAFDDNVCWYSHKDKPNKSTVLKEFKCRFCDKSFKRKEEFMIHRKTEHKNFIPACRADNIDSCRFTEKECWYQHKPEENLMNYDEINMEYPNNVNQRILDVMEKFTERLQMLEDQI